MNNSWWSRWVGVVVLGCGALAAQSGRGENWPQFRGPTGMGTTTETGLPIKWGADGKENIVWKVPLPGAEAKDKEKVDFDQNQSSPIVWGDRVFVTNVLWAAGKTRKEMPEQHVTCYSTKDGAQLWDVTVKPGPVLLTDLRCGYGAPTPATDGQRVYVAFGSGTIAALECSTGGLAWQKDIDEAKDIDVGLGTSPMLYQDTLIMLCDKYHEHSTLTAYDCKTGDVRWEKKRPDSTYNHSTPTFTTVNGKTQMLVAANKALQGIDPTTGEIIWWCTVSGDVCSPIVFDGLVYTDSGRGGPGVAVDPTGTGDVTKTNVKWKIGQIPEALSSPVACQGFLFRTHNPATLKCYKLDDGKEQYASRLEYASPRTSPIATPEGRVYVCSGRKSFVIQAGPKFDLLATNDLQDANDSSPAVSGGRLYIKGTHYLFCIGANGTK